MTYNFRPMALPAGVHFGQNFGWAVLNPAKPEHYDFYVIKYTQQGLQSGNKSRRGHAPSWARPRWFFFPDVLDWFFFPARLYIHIT